MKNTPLTTGTTQRHESRERETSKGRGRWGGGEKKKCRHTPQMDEMSLCVRMDYRYNVPPVLQKVLEKGGFFNESVKHGENYCERGADLKKKWLGIKPSSDSVPFWCMIGVPTTQSPTPI